MASQVSLPSTQWIAISARWPAMRVGTYAVFDALRTGFCRSGRRSWSLTLLAASYYRGTTFSGAEAIRRIVAELDSGRLGNPARVSAGIVRCCFDRRRREGLRGVGEQLSWVVGHRLIGIDRVRLRKRHNHVTSKPARGVDFRSISGTGRA
jgi:hypothetical protein